MFKLSEKAMLVSVNISQWEARKLDKKETAKTNTDAGAKAGVARVTKSLLPSAISLDLVHKKTGVIRNDCYYALTSPWMSKGPRIMKAEGYLDFTRILGEHIQEWEGLKRNFIADYRYQRDVARTDLGGMFDEADYPPVWQVEQKFDVNVSFMPLPDEADWRVDMSDEHIEYLKAGIVRQTQEGLATATADAWQRVHKVVANAQERLRNPDNKFKDTLVENARDLCKVLPMLNITDDPQLEAIRQQLEGSLCAVEPDVLREDTSVRLAVSDKMADIMAKMSGMYGAGQVAA